MPDNRKPLKYGAFPVCRNYTVRAHLRNPCSTKRNRCKDCIQYVGAQQCRIHFGDLYAHNKQGTGNGGSKDGKPAETSTMILIKNKKHREDSTSSRCFLQIKIWVKFGSNLGQTAFAIVFSKAQVRKKEISFAVFLSSKAAFLQETPIFNRQIIRTIWKANKRKVPISRRNRNLWGG